MKRNEYIKELSGELGINQFRTTIIINHTEALIKEAGIDEYANYESLEAILSTLTTLAGEKRLWEVVDVLSDHFKEYIWIPTNAELSDRKAYLSSLEKKFRIYQEEGKELIEGLTYPRFKGEVNIKGFLSAIDNIDLMEECKNASVLARVMKQAGDFIDNKRYTFR
jgi:hypothetical protein